MPLGSSSDAPVISPGPSIARKPRRSFALAREASGAARARRQWCRFGRTPVSRGIALQEAAQQVEEPVEPVVMDPVAGALERHHFRILEMADAAVLLGIGGPAFLAVDEQRRAGDARPQILGLGLGHAVGPVGADVIVELPAIGAIFVLVDR